MTMAIKSLLQQCNTIVIVYNGYAKRKEIALADNAGAIVYEKFPTAGAIKVCGKTAESLKNTTRLTILGAYNFLIYSREDEAHALNDLRKGLPVK